MKRLLLLLVPIICLSTTIERDTLDNGLVVLAVEAHKIPVVEMRAYVRAGSVYDPDGKEGLANIVASMLMRGTKTRSAQDIAGSIESVGGVLSPFCDEDHLGLSGKVLSRDLPLLVDLLADCLRNPVFDSTEFTRVKSEVGSAIRAKSDDPMEISNREFRRLVFDDHQLAHLAEGHDATVAALTDSDGRKYHSDNIAPGNTFLVFVGDFVMDSLMVLLRNAFGDWGRRAVAAVDYDLPLPVSHAVGRIVPMSISQAYIMLGHIGPGYEVRDWLPLRLTNYILGGRSVGYIWDKVREEKGLAYDAYSYFKRFRRGGYFCVEVQTKKEMAREAVVTVLEAIKHVQDSLRAADLDLARDFFTGYLPLAVDSYSKMAGIVAQIEIEGLGLDYIDTFQASVQRVDLKQMVEAARQHLFPDQYCLLIVGDLRPEDIDIDGIEWLE